MPDAIPMIVVFSVALLVAGGIALFALYTARQFFLKLKTQELELMRLRNAEESLRKEAEEYVKLKREYMQLLEDKSIAVTERSEAMRQLEEVREERNITREKLREAESDLAEADKRTELIEQRMKDTASRMQDWEKQKEEMMLAARASILKAGGEMSNKLLADHKREAEDVKKQQEEQIKKTTEKLTEQFMEVTKAVASIKDQSQDARQQMDTVMRALTNPGGAGQMAEVGLENSLKNLGLEPGRDFVMQYHIRREDASNLRPDAVVFLPQDMVIVVDSKASKFLIELAEHEGGEQEAAMMERLKRSMNEHVRALGSKQYQAAVLQQFKEAGKGQQIGYMFNVMYLPSESAIEKIRLADPDFNQKLEKANIILAGPASLSGLFSLAKMNIAAAQRAENEQVIMETVSDLMESVATVFAYANNVGRGLTSAMKHFNDFSKSANARLLPRMQKLSDLGVQASKNKQVPTRMPTYDVHRSDETLTLSAEEEKKADVHQLTQKKRETA